MTTALAAPDTVGADRYEPALDLDRVMESPLNPRTHYDPAKLKELGASMLAKGQLTPVLVRPVRGVGGIVYELAAGHRRYRARKLAGLSSIAAVVRDMNDAEFLEVLTVENMQRDDLTPLEEARGYAALLNLPGYDVPTIAAKVSKSESYVHRRLTLQKLIATAKTALAKGEIELGHAEVLAPLPDPLQKELLRRCIENNWGDRWTIRQLRRQVQEHHLLELRRAPWKLGDATLPGGACAACPKRTGASPALFADLANDDSCLDGTCHAAKLQAYLTRRETELRAEHGKDLVILDQRPYGDGSVPKGSVSKYDVEVVKKGTQGAAPALIWRSDKADVGHVVYVRKPVKKKSAPDSYMKQQRAKQEKARITTQGNLAAVQAVLDRIGKEKWDYLEPEYFTPILASLIGEAHHETCRVLGTLPGLLPGAKTRLSAEKAMPLIAALTDVQRVQLLAALALVPHAHVYSYSTTRASLADVCKPFGVNPETHRKRIKAAADAAKKAKASKNAKRPKATAKKTVKPKTQKAAKSGGPKHTAKRRAGDVAAARKKKTKASDSPACEVCGCTEDHACPGGCSWDPALYEQGRYVCDNCVGEQEDDDAADD